MKLWAEMMTRLRRANRGGQPLDGVVSVGQIDGGVRARGSVRREMPMDDIRMMPIRPCCSVEMLRRQQAQGDDGQDRERCDEPMPRMRRHDRDYVSGVWVASNGTHRYAPGSLFLEHLAK